MKRHSLQLLRTALACAFLAGAAVARAQVEYDWGSQRPEDRDHEWRFYLGGLTTLSGTIDETFRAFYAATGQDYKQALAESYKLDDFGVDCPYVAWGVQYEREWSMWAFKWDAKFFDLSADATARRDYYVGVGKDIHYGGRSYDHLMIPKGRAFSIDFFGAMSDLLFSFTPFTFFYGGDDEHKLTPSLDLGLVLFGGDMKVDAGKTTGTTVYQNPPVDFAVGGKSSMPVVIGAPKIGIGADYRVGPDDGFQWVFHGDIGYFTYSGSTKFLTSSSHREKEIEVNYLSVTGEAGCAFPLYDGSALSLGVRVQVVSIEGSINSKEKDQAAIIAARERFDKSVDLMLTTMMLYVGYNY